MAVISAPVPIAIWAKIGIWVAAVIAIISVIWIIESISPIRISIAIKSPSAITIIGVAPTIIGVPAIIWIGIRVIKVIPIRVVPEIIKTKNSATSQ